ncbi:hypothetical protein B0I35DRAFT_473772 [Stachybotrys elegans]|uniref:DUF7729 domain-containing protein n=1 Tax=Stachybotrys elegans TaxID=80388 RepID=A0A8K0WY47_9HYPO|nr:hypothetical protein B0I35DRAFT_473772 [Stachybotrys elegans]
MASLSSTVMAQPQGPYPPQITRRADIEAPTSIVLDTVPLTSFTRPAPSPLPQELRRRQNRDNDDDEDRTSSEDEDARRTTSGATSESRTRSEDDEPTSTGSAATLTISIPPTATSLPRPFDDAPFAEFRLDGDDDSCPIFIADLLSNPNFLACYPASMMLMSSASFFRAQSNLLDMVRVLDATCEPDVVMCTEYLNSAAQNLTASENCGNEFNANHRRTMYAYNALRSYEMLYAATCLQDSTDDEDLYCYAKAVTNTSAPSDSYIYLLPYGLQMPGASRVTCSQCTQDTMAIFHSASADRSQPIAESYEPAALQVNTICGPNFVNATMPSPDSAGVRQSLPLQLAITLGICVYFTVNMLF